MDHPDPHEAVSFEDTLLERLAESHPENHVSEAMAHSVTRLPDGQTNKDD